MTQMSNITAVVLTIGEGTTQRAIDSIKGQTLPADELIVVENVTPFHKALNLGASKVKTEFFVQVDADMILDPCCLQILGQCMAPNVGIALGRLRDPMIGRMVGIKMFRKACFEKLQFPDSISPDTDFRDKLSDYGWARVSVLRFSGEDKELWHTLGEHQPAYSPHYTFSKYLRLGGRYRYRKSLSGFLQDMRKLQDSKHAMSLIAQIALAHGAFLEEERDLLEPYGKDRQFEFFERFSQSMERLKLNKFDLLLSLYASPKLAFKKYYKLGISLRKAAAYTEFINWLDILNQSRYSFALIAKVGLCHGIFLESYNDATFQREYTMLKKLLWGHVTASILK